MQVPITTVGDLDTILYVIFPCLKVLLRSRGTKSITPGSRLRALRRLNKLGLYFTQEKREAILHGDTSNSAVNRYFVDALQAIGMYLCEAPEQTPAMVRLQAKYSQRAWESLIHLKQTDQERAKVQALLLVAHSFIMLGFTAGAQLYFVKAYKIIEEELRFLPEYGPPAEFSEQVHEEASVLSEAIYLENYLYLALGGPAPVKTVRIEREFRFDLPVRTIRYLFAVGFEINLVVWPSGCTQISSRNALWPYGLKAFCWSEMRSTLLTPLIVRLI